MPNHEIYLIKFGDNAITYAGENLPLQLKAFDPKSQNQHFLFDSKSGHLIPHALIGKKHAGLYVQEKDIRGNKFQVIYAGVSKENLLLHFAKQADEQENEQFFMIDKSRKNHALTAAFKNVVLEKLQHNKRHNQSWSFQQPMMYRQNIKYKSEFKILKNVENTKRGKKKAEEYNSDDDSEDDSDYSDSDDSDRDSDSDEEEAPVVKPRKAPPAKKKPVAKPKPIVTKAMLLKQIGTLYSVKELQQLVQSKQN